VIKVAGYCRVSTDQEDQANSFESQQRYFREYSLHHPDWELFDIYADEGITGTSTKNRTQFRRMIQDAYEGKFQLIITKEVSRFSRNILDTISYTRELKAIGVGVYFMLDGINSLNPDAELYLSIMASLAQEESRKTSARVIWGQTRQMEKGVVFGRSLLGYDVKEGRLTINPQGAEIVRLIFQKYGVEQLCTSEIVGLLSREGYPTCSGSSNWTAQSVIKILKNEKYVGDLIQKKTYTPDYLTHERRKNKGEVPLIRIENHHEPIISREIWNLAQERLRKNNKHEGKQSGHSSRYAFSGKIRCGECGSVFSARYRYLKDGSKIRRWSCSRAVRGGADACTIGMLLRDDDAAQMMKTALSSLQLDIGTIIAKVTELAMNGIRAEGQGGGECSALLRKELDRIGRKKDAMLDSFFSGDISTAEMQSMRQHYDQQLQAVTLHLNRMNDTGEASEAAIVSDLTSILAGRIAHDVLYKSLLEGITVFKDRYLELKLYHLPHVFRFIG